MTRTLINFDPTSEFRSFEQVFDSLFGKSYKPAPGTASLPLDIIERGNTLYVTAPVPGVNPSELEVTIENNVLTIKGESKHTAENEGDKVYRREVYFGAFSRSIRLPEKLDVENVSADFTNGLVTISIPRLPEAKPRSVKVAVRGQEAPKAIEEESSSPEQAN